VDGKQKPAGNEGSVGLTVNRLQDPPVNSATNENSASPSKPRPGPKLIYGLAIFCSAFLLFQVEPLIAKIILPWFGGAAAVWTTCLLFFQVVLLLGYLYAHLLTRAFRPRTQGWVHIALLAASLLALPILPKDSWKPSGLEDPTLRVLLILALTVGGPYFLLSATSPLLQAWYVRARTGAAPYRFYALSNAGSMLALLSYPVLIEPATSSSHQAFGWSIAYAVVAVLCTIVALSRRSEAVAVEPPEAVPRPDWKTQALWVALAACGSALLLAVTNHITQNIASVPFLWVIPLSLYLLSFILCFEGRAWYRRNFFLRLLGVALGGMTYALAPDFANAPLYVLIPLYCSGLFVCCMFCHGELALLKPHPAHLTSFYVMCSLGGAMGAVFVALLAPRIFSGYYELHVAMATCAILVLVVYGRGPGSKAHKGRWQLARLVLLFLAGAIIASLYVTALQQAANARLMVRNFYGVLRVIDQVAPNVVLLQGKAGQALDDDPRYRKLMNGTIDHGLQFFAPARSRQPTSYYGPDSGVGLALTIAGKRGPLRVGAIGLGAGTIAAYGRPGDHYIFYEINPLVVQVANQEFTFLRDSAARIDVLLGDARLSLERESPQGFNVLVVDAFSGDSIPVHLLTREAFALYFRHLEPDGVLAVHVSNKHLFLQPVVAGAATKLNKEAVIVNSADDGRKGIYHATWILVGSREGFFGQPEIEKAGKPLTGSRQQSWTDDYSSLFRILK
jgi:SAM-dependent methyltransferase